MQITLDDLKQITQTINQLASRVQELESNELPVISGDVTLANDGTIKVESLSLPDTDDSHDLNLVWNENATADRILNLNLNNGTRALTLQGNLTVESASRINQDVTSDGSPAFGGLTVNGPTYLSSWGDRFFTADDGLLLLGPHCPITETEWTSLRGQVADLSGAFHQVAGAWPGTRALMIEGEGQNYCDGSDMYDGDSNGQADQWTYSNTVSGSPTTSVIVHDSEQLGWMQRVQYTGQAGDGGASIKFQSNSTSAGSFSSGQTCTVSLDIRGVCTDQINVVIHARDSGDTYIDNSSTSFTVTPGMTRIVAKYNSLPVNTSRVRVYVQFIDVDDGDEIDFRFGAVNIEKGGANSSPMIGGLPWCSWDGAAHQSQVSRTATGVDLDEHIDLISENTEFGWGVWVQMPADYDGGTWPETSNFFMEADGTGLPYIIFYDTTDTSIKAYIAGTTLEASASFGAGDWVFIWVNHDFTNDDYELYVDGELKDNSSASRSAQTMTSWGLPNDTQNTNHPNAVYSQIVVCDSILTAEEVSALYQRNAPLVDTGAFDTPVVGGRVVIVPISEDNVSNPPTDSELDDAFGAQPDGFSALVDDAGAGSTVWRVYRVASAWWYEELTKAT
jgi:hypothetical protein